jgi:hypothetical protein
MEQDATLRDIVMTADRVPTVRPHEAPLPCVHQATVDMQVFQHREHHRVLHRQVSCDSENVSEVIARSRELLRIPQGWRGAQ